jgi:nicotinate phosphoribosyltransferase
MWSRSFLADGRALRDAERLLEAGMADRRASFDVALGGLPPHHGFAVVAGVDALLRALAGPLVDENELASAVAAGHLGGELARRLALPTANLDVDGVLDGTVVVARTPVATVEGPLLEAMLVAGLVRASLERATAIATRTARLCIAAGSDSIVDASSALAPRPDAMLATARAAHIGGAARTTSVVAALELGIPLSHARGAALGSLVPPAVASDDLWGASASDETAELGAGDEEEAALVEAKRQGRSVGGWLVQGLADAPAAAFGMRAELVAIEERGAWAPRRGATDTADVVPGRKMVVRYTDANGRAVADVVHLDHERMEAPRALGAATLAPLARALVRNGRTMELPEPCGTARERSIAGRRALPPAVAYLRTPDVYPVELSAGVRALLQARR